MNTFSKTSLYTNEPLFTRIFWAFVCIHLSVWTVLPWCIRYNLPMDSLEGYVWGQQLEWGYDKNPVLNGWLTALAVKLGGYSGWSIYLFSQLSVVLCFWAVWQLGKKLLPPVYALVGVLVLEAIQYYNFHAIDFNDNTLELSLWALLILSFYHAVRAPSSRRATAAWLACGLFAGLSMLCKYYAVVLFLPMAIFLFRFKENYRCFTQPGFYLGIALFVLMITPHIVWLCSHDFITLHYALDRVSSPPTLWHHLEYPWQFFYEQLEALTPALLLALFLLIGKKPLSLTPRFSLSTVERTFLMMMAIGPFMVTLLLSLGAGFKLRAGWGEPLFSLSGLLLMAILQPRITRRRFYGFIGLLMSLFTIAVIGYSWAFIQGKHPSSANFPGKIMAAKLTHEWHHHYYQRLAYVGGSRWLSSNVAFYSPDHPQVYINWNSQLSPWIKESELQQKGAIFLWEKQEAVPKDLQARFPHLQQKQIMHFSWLRNKQLPPIEINLAYLPPAANAQPQP